MKQAPFPLAGLFLFLSAFSLAGGDPLAPFRAKADEYGSVLTIPEFERSADAVKKSMEGAIAEADKKLGEIAKRDPKSATFDEGPGAIDRVLGEIDRVASRIYFLSSTATDAELRKVASERVEAFSKWLIGVSFREDLYRFTKAFSAELANRDLRVTDEQTRLLEESLKSYRRNGMELPPKKREQVKALQEKLTELETAFSRNLSETKSELLFSESELKGIPAETLRAWPRKDGKVVVSATTADKATVVLRLAESSETRRKMELARNTIQREANAKILRDAVNLRVRIAKLLGYKTWSHMRLEPNMAKTPEKVMKFLSNLNDGLEPKLKSEMRELEAAKRKHLGLGPEDGRGKVETWDVEFYFNRIASERYSIDREALRAYFPMEKTVDGMFAIYQRIFGLKFHEIEPPYKWVEDLRAFVVTDRKTEEPLGIFYLDMYPREGKYGHFAQFGLVSGMRRADGKYERPTVSLVCNFPKPVEGKPSLLLHEEVETLFHEFGHAMHSIMTRAEYSSFSGTSVARDFVEAPSQMLENWVWDQEVLDTFAADYRDPAKKFPAATLKKLEEIRLAEIARATRRQISFGLLDQKLHSMTKPDESLDPVALSNGYIEESWGLKLQPGYSFVTRFGHLLGGYDAGYYGYLWAESISADMAESFARSRGRFLDEKTGMKLRNEVYAAGNSRPIEESVRAFLGRDSTMDAFLRKLGLQKK